jgi:drug/metabolite transporter (DMT)-like permease
VTGIGVFSLQDLIIKLISGEYPVHQVLTIRSLVAMPVLLALVAFDGGLRTVASRRAPALIFRSVLMFIAYTTYYLGLASLSLATAVSLYFASPLFITVLSVWLLREKVGPRRWAAVLVGFLGVVVMVRPGSELFEWASLLPVCAGLAYAVSQVTARKLGETESAAVMATYGNFVFMAAGLVLIIVFGAGNFANEGHPSLAFLVRGWSTPGTVDLLLMMSCGIIAAVGLTLLTEAYRSAQANIVAPFEYTALIWGVLFGWLFWRELPDLVGWIGMAVIIGAGLYILYREK